MPGHRDDGRRMHGCSATVIEPSALVSAPAAQSTRRVGRVTDLVGDHHGGGLEVAAGVTAGVGSAAQQTAGTSAHAAMSATCEPELWIVYLWVRVVNFMQVQYWRLGARPWAAWS